MFMSLDKIELFMFQNGIGSTNISWAPNIHQALSLKSLEFTDEIDTLAA